MSMLKKVIIVLMSFTLLLNVIEAGPLSMNVQRAFRNGREIRAPFKNPEIMVARGFGKRDAIHVNNDKIDNGGGIEDLNDESIPLDWVAKEISMNPLLAQKILHRFVDTNNDGLITLREMLGNQAFPETNEIY